MTKRMVFLEAAWAPVAGAALVALMMSTAFGASIRAPLPELAGDRAMIGIERVAGGARARPSPMRQQFDRARLQLGASEAAHRAVSRLRGARADPQSRLGSIQLARKLAAESLLARNAGRTIAGPGGGAPFRNARFYAERFGGRPSDWVKRSSAAIPVRSSREGLSVHWVENRRTRERFSFKIKLDPLNGK